MVTVVVTGHSSRRSPPPRWTPTGNGLQRGQFCWPPLGKTVGRQRAATWPPLGRISWPPTGNSQDKDEGGFSEETCRVASFVAHIITATLIEVINNLEEARRYPIHQEQQQRKAKRKKAAAKANEAEQRNGSAGHQPATEDPTRTAAADNSATATKPSLNGTAANKPGNEEPDEPDHGETADTATTAMSKGHSADASQADRPSRTTTSGPTNSSNRRGRNKRRRQPQQRQQTPPNGRSPPVN